MHHFHLPTMSCGGCLKAVTRALQALDPAVRIEADQARRIIVVTSGRSEAALIDALHRAGYAAEPVLVPLG